MVEDLRASSPTMADMMAKSYENPQNPVAITCVADKQRLTIADINEKVDVTEFSEQVKSWPVVANSSSLHQEGTIAAGFFPLTKRVC